MAIFLIVVLAVFPIRQSCRRQSCSTRIRFYHHTSRASRVSRNLLQKLQRTDGWKKFTVKKIQYLTAQNDIFGCKRLILKDHQYIVKIYVSLSILRFLKSRGNEHLTFRYFTFGLLCVFESCFQLFNLRSLQTALVNTSLIVFALSRHFFKVLQPFLRFR